MTDTMMSLQALVEKSADADLLREMVGFAAQRLMELGVEGLTGAVHGVPVPFLQRVSGLLQTWGSDDLARSRDRSDVEHPYPLR